MECQGGRHGQACFGTAAFDPVDTRSPLPSVGLGHRADRERFGGLPYEPTFYSTYGACSTALLRFVKPLVQPIDRPCSLLPGNGLPLVAHTGWCRVLHELPHCYSQLYSANNRLHVSISSGFPRGVGFLKNPSL